MLKSETGSLIKSERKNLSISCISICQKILASNDFEVQLYPNNSFRAYNEEKDYEVWFACNKDNVPQTPIDLWATNAVYILLWLGDSQNKDILPAVYTGQTNDIKRRVKEHTSDINRGKNFEGRQFDCFLWFRKAKMPLNPIDALNLERELYYMLRGTIGCLFTIRKKNVEKQFISTGPNEFSFDIADREFIFKLQNKEEPSAPSHSIDTYSLLGESERCNIVSIMTSITAQLLRYDISLSPDYFKLKNVKNDGEEQTLQDIFNANMLGKSNACSASYYRLSNDIVGIEDVLFYPYAGFYVGEKMLPMSSEIPICIAGENSNSKESKAIKKKAKKAGNNGWRIQIVNDTESKSSEDNQGEMRLSEIYKNYEIERKRWNYPPLLHLQEIVSMFPIFSAELRYQSIDVMIDRWRLQTAILVTVLSIVVIVSLPFPYVFIVLITFALIAGFVGLAFHRSKKYAIRACTGQERE